MLNDTSVILDRALSASITLLAGFIADQPALWNEAIGVAKPARHFEVLLCSNTPCKDPHARRLR